MEVQGHHGNRSRHPGAWHRRDDGDLLTFFTKEANRPGSDKVIVLTQSYWRTQYQESPEVVGKEVRIDDEAYKVIGVAPRAAGLMSRERATLERKQSEHHLYAR